MGQITVIYIPNFDVFEQFFAVLFRYLLLLTVIYNSNIYYFRLGNSIGKVEIMPVVILYVYCPP